MAILHVDDGDDLSIKMNNTSAPKASCKTKTGLMKVSFLEFTLLNLWCLKGTKNIEPLKSKTNQMFTTFKFMSHVNISPSVWHILLWREKLFNFRKSLDLPQNCFQVNPCEAAVVSTGFWMMMLVCTPPQSFKSNDQDVIQVQLSFKGFNIRIRLTVYISFYTQSPKLHNWQTSSFYLSIQFPQSGSFI